MILKKTFNVALSAFVLLASMLVIAPAAEAQVVDGCNDVAKASITPTISAPDKAIRPIVDTAVLKAKVEYKVDDNRANTIVPILVEIEARAEDAPWAVVTASPARVFVTESDLPSKTIDVDIQVAFTKDAPAFAKKNIILSAKADGGTCISPVAAQESKALVTADFYERTQVRFEKTIFKASQNAQVTLPMTFENFGNGAIQVRLTAGEKSSDDLVMALPGQQIVQSTIAGGETSKLTVNLDVKTPFKNGYENRQDALIIDVNGNSADDSTKSINPLSVSAVIQTQGVYVPGFEAVTLLGAVLAMAFLARRRL